jgi:hypothetical protein
VYNYTSLKGPTRPGRLTAASTTAPDITSAMGLRECASSRQSRAFVDVAAQGLSDCS